MMRSLIAIIFISFSSPFRDTFATHLSVREMENGRERRIEHENEMKNLYEKSVCTIVIMSKELWSFSHPNILNGFNIINSLCFSC